MKILHYINDLGSGGAEKLLSDILPLMKVRGHEVHLMISNSKASAPKYEKILAEGGIPINSLNLSFYNPYQIIRAIGVLRREKYDIVHAHLFPSQYWLAFASFFRPAKTKLVKTEHSVFNERKHYAILRPLEKFVYSRYHEIIGITEQVTQNLQEWLHGKARIVTIKNGVNLSQIAEAQKETTLADYGFLRKEHYNILMVGRFDGWQKDQGSLIEALQFLPENVNLYFAGEGPELSATKEKALKAGAGDRVHFLGMRNDVYKLMNLVDLNVLSTNHEGLSGVALESLASRKPFLGSDVVGVNNVVPDADFLFPSQNPRAMADRILKVIKDPGFRDSLTERAKTYVQDYDIPVMVGKYLELYQSLVQHG